MGCVQYQQQKVSAVLFCIPGPVPVLSSFLVYGSGSTFVSYRIGILPLFLLNFFVEHRQKSLEVPKHNTGLEKSEELMKFLYKTVCNVFLNMQFSAGSRTRDLHQSIHHSENCKEVLFGQTLAVPKINIRRAQRLPRSNRAGRHLTTNRLGRRPLGSITGCARRPIRIATARRSKLLAGPASILALFVQLLLHGTHLGFHLLELALYFLFLLLSTTLFLLISCDVTALLDVSMIS
jgi:hypothetical protein